jgi:hypothetical protein
LAEASRLLWDAINDGREIEAEFKAETDWTETGRAPAGGCEILIRIKAPRLCQAACGEEADLVSTSSA